MGIHRTKIFIHNSALCHKSKVVFLWLSSKDIEVLEWPDNSLDINLIENTWNYLKDIVAELRAWCTKIAK